MNNPAVPANSAFAGALADDKKAEILREVYRKHTAELLAIEDAQQKLVLLILGIFGAGASYLSKGQYTSLAAQVGLTAATISILILGHHFTKERSRARQNTRFLLVRCEEALGFYAEGQYLTSQPLYAPELLGFHKKGHWLARGIFLTWLAALGFLLVLWAPRFVLFWPWLA
jgi:hypothetical protein